jgi:monoamine oxidase
MTMRRRTLLAAGSSLPWLAACSQGEAALTSWPGGWVGASHERGHRLREPAGAPTPAVQRRAHVLVVGAGIAGLSAARTLMAAGIDDVHVLDLEDGPGGNSRGHTMAGMACPLGAHYLPTPGPHAHEVAGWLAELGLLRTEAGRTVYDERHLCHSPQERLFIDGGWVDGLLPPAAEGSATSNQYRRFAAAVDAMRHALPFAMPTLRAAWTAGHAALDAQPFSQWLATQGIHDERLRWYLDYCCRDDYGAGLETVSAWAGLHYFASRHGFHAPGDTAEERDGVLTWPEGNAWLMQRLAAPLGAERFHGARVATRVDAGRFDVSIDVLHAPTQRSERWTARHVVLALPLFIAARVFEAPPAALVEAARALRYAPWLVANLHLEEPLLDRAGAAPSWDNVLYGSQALGYVDAMHQSTRPYAGPTVLTAYWALPEAQRGALLQAPWQAWAQRVVADLAPAHPDLPRKISRVDLMRYGHAMSIPVPGVRGSAALRALAELPGRVHIAHSDLSGYSVFEEAFTWGALAGRRIAGLNAA